MRSMERSRNEMERRVIAYDETDPLRPDDTDEEPWTIEEEPETQELAKRFVYTVVLVVVVSTLVAIAWRISR